MANDDGGREARRFTVVLRGPSAAIFEQDAGLLLRELNPKVGPLEVHVRTRWREFGPGHIWLEVTGSAESISEAIAQFCRSAIAFLPPLAFAANAAIDDCDFELAFDSTSGIEERDYVQHFVPDEVPHPREARRIDPRATVSLLEAIQASPERERILRAVAQYHIALQSWRFGYETLAVAHLWMAIEAVTKAFLRREIAQRGLNGQQALAAALGIDVKELDSYVRRTVILQGDAECYRDGKAASDGFEHGFLGFDEVQNKSAAVRERMAALVREAIIEYIEVDDEQKGVLLGEQYRRPLGNSAFSRVVRGQLIGKGEKLGVAGSPYPYFGWTVGISKAQPTEGGRVSVTITESLTASLADGITFRPARHELWRR